MENYRERYADAFVQRCLELSDESDDSSTGEEAYLCTWLWRPAKYCCNACKKEIVVVRHYCRGSVEEHADSCTAAPLVFVECISEDEDLDKALEEAAFDTADSSSETQVIDTPEKDLIGKVADGWCPELCLADCNVKCSEMSDSWAKTALAPSPHTCRRELALIQVMPKTRPGFVSDGQLGTDFYHVQGQNERVLCYSKDTVGTWDRQAWPPIKHGPLFFLDDDDDELDDCLDRFAKIPMRGLNPSLYAQSDGIQQHGGTRCDVFTTDCSDLISFVKPILNKQAKLSNDRPVPKYQNIIDPNLFVRKRKSDNMHVWVPSEFDVSSDGSSVELVGKDGDRAHYLPSELIDQVATPVLLRSLTLLARLRRPHLLLEDQRLQVAVKAQRIETRKQNPDGDEPFSSYQGLWHVDGQHEAVVAAVLFYYHVEDSIQGGKMEFIDRQPMDVLGSGDTLLTGRDFNGHYLREALRPESLEHPLVPNCTVPVEDGTMLVFSNYQMAHRVLKMVNTSCEKDASRDFVALFIFDPAADPLVPARCHLSIPCVYRMTLGGNIRGLSDLHIATETINLILEFMGVVPTEKCSRRHSTQLSKEYSLDSFRRAHHFHANDYNTRPVGQTNRDFIWANIIEPLLAGTGVVFFKRDLYEHNRFIQLQWNDGRLNPVLQMIEKELRWRRPHQNPQHRPPKSDCYKPILGVHNSIVRSEQEAINETRGMLTLCLPQTHHIASHIAQYEEFQLDRLWRKLKIQVSDRTLLDDAEPIKTQQLLTSIANAGGQWLYATGESADSDLPRYRHFSQEDVAANKLFQYNIAKKMEQGFDMEELAAHVLELMGMQPRGN